MELSISNIGWEKENDIPVYHLMKKYEYDGLEIAPTRIFPESPYAKLDLAAAWAERLREEYGFSVPSMQSIWFGRKEQLFGTEDEWNVLVDYTKKAVDFAVKIQCSNLVFGCPGNRNVPEGADWEVGIKFFKIIGDYAAEKGTVIGMEANPPVYHTNYINDTASALELIEKVGSNGFKLNLDVGTMIQNHESLDELKGKGKLIHHVHISEPGLKPIEKRTFHKELKTLLDAENYQGFISIEMGKTDDLNIVENAMEYVKEVFHS